jgi:prevent-host-death family protein
LPEIGVRELKARASEIVRKVHDERVRYTITRRGKPVGLILPLVETPPDTASADAAWDRLMEIGAEIARGWPEGVDSAQVISDMRR